MPMPKYKLGLRSLRNLETVDKNLQAVVKRAIEITDQDFTVHMGARTAAEQNALYQIGRRGIAGEKIVTSKDGYKNKSNHQIDPRDGLGNSVDLVPWSRGKPVWDWDLIYPIAAAMSRASKELKVPIKWGGNWYERMDQYGCDIASIKEAVERYKKAHPGPDFIDGPHYEMA